VPGGVAKTFIPTKETELKSAFDEWLARVVCFAFSISPQPFTDHVNRATAETAQAAALAEGLAPIQNWVKQLVDYLLITEFDAPDLEFAWRDEREIDAQKLAGITQIYVTHGIKTVNEARAEIGLDPVEGGDTPMVFTGTGAVPLAQAARGGDAGGAEAAAKALAKYSPDQPRDERGRWTSDGGASAHPTIKPVQIAQADTGVMSDAVGDDGRVTSPAGSDNASDGIRIAADESEAARAMRAMPAMGAARAMAAARNPAAAGSLLRPIIEQNPAEYANSRAMVLQSALSRRTNTSVTVAVGVVEDAQGVRSVVIATTEKGAEGLSYLRPSVQLLRQPSETIAPYKDAHAEMSILAYGKENNLKVIAVGAGRPYCPECGPAPDAAGVLATGPRK